MFLQACHVYFIIFESPVQDNRDSLCVLDIRLQDPAGALKVGLGDMAIACPVWDRTFRLSVSEDLCYQGY